MNINYAQNKNIFYGFGGLVMVSGPKLSESKVKINVRAQKDSKLRARAGKFDNYLLFVYTIW